nr:hypothetical protein [Staphylococcus aureus]
MSLFIIIREGFIFLARNYVPAPNPDIENGFIYTGDIHIILVQILCVTAVVIFSIVMTFIIAKVIKLITPLSVTEQETNIGLDKIVHGEHAYFEGELNRFNKHIRY